MRLFHPLSDPPIALLWAGLTTSAVGDNLFSIALTWVAIGLFGPAAGYLTALQAAIVLLGAGALPDGGGGHDGNWRTNGRHHHGDTGPDAIASD